MTALPRGHCVASGKFLPLIWRMTQSDEMQTGARRFELSNGAHKTEARIVFQETPFGIHYHRKKLWLRPSIWGSPTSALVYQQSWGGHLNIVSRAVTRRTPCGGNGGNVPPNLSRSIVYRSSVTRRGLSKTGYSHERLHRSVGGTFSNPES